MGMKLCLKALKKWHRAEHLTDIYTRDNCLDGFLAHLVFSLTDGVTGPAMVVSFESFHRMLVLWWADWLMLTVDDNNFRFTVMSHVTGKNIHSLWKDFQWEIPLLGLVLSGHKCKYHILSANFLTSGSICSNELDLLSLPEGPIDRLSMEPTLDVRQPESIITSLIYSIVLMFFCFGKVQLVPSVRKTNMKRLFSAPVAAGFNCFKCIPHKMGLFRVPEFFQKSNSFHPWPSNKTPGSSQYGWGWVGVTPRPDWPNSKRMKEKDFFVSFSSTA